MWQAPAILARRDQWRHLPQENLRDVVADAFDQNDRDHVQLANQLRRNNTLLTGVFVTLTTSSILLALNLVIGTLGIGG